MLLDAVDRKDISRVRLLIEHHAALEEKILPNMADRESTPLLLAAGRGYAEIAEILLAAGADPFRREKGENALLRAVTGAHLDVVQMLVKKFPAIVNNRDANGETALVYALRSPERVKTVKLLLEAGANIREKDNTGRSALSHAVLYADGAVMEVLAPFCSVSDLRQAAAESRRQGREKLAVFIEEMNARNLKRIEDEGMNGVPVSVLRDLPRLIIRKKTPKP